MYKCELEIWFPDSHPELDPLGKMVYLASMPRVGEKVQVGSMQFDVIEVTHLIQAIESDPMITEHCGTRVKCEIPSWDETADPSKIEGELAQMGWAVMGP